MPTGLPAAYLRISERALAAADAAIAHTVQEKAGFLAYHAFESMGGAMCASRGVAYHPANHRQKLQRFVTAVRQERFALAAAQLASEVASLRNAFLYPRILQTGSIGMPEQVITTAQATRLVGRVRTLGGRVQGAV
jgi:hypothetical protein